MSYGVIKNRSWSRLLYVATFATYIVLSEIQGGILNNWGESLSPITAVLVLFWWATACYLYLAKRSRAYFLIIAGKALPEDLRGVTFETPTWVESSLNVFALAAELGG